MTFRRSIDTDIENDEMEPLFDNLRTEQEVKPWDIFKDPPRKNISSSMEETKALDNSIIILKIFTCILTFICVIGGSVISKGTLLFMTSQIKINQSRIYCNQDLDTSSQFFATISDKERVAWMWIIVFVFFVPEIQTLLRSLRILIFKSWFMPTKMEFIITFISETLSTIGTAIFVFCVLPEIDVIKGAMLTCGTCLVPAIVGLISSGRKSGMLVFALDVISIVAQLSALVVWPVLSENVSLFLIPISLFLVSCGWWENFVSEDSTTPFIKNYALSRKEFKNDRYFIYAFVSVWKCILFLSTVVLIIYIQEGRAIFFFEEFYSAFQEHQINITEIEPIIGEITSVGIAEAIATGDRTTIVADYMTPVWVFLINIFGSYIAYIFGKFACKIMVQIPCFAFPVNLSVPALISMLVAFCGIHNMDECAFKNIIPQYLAFNGPSLYFLRNLIENEYAWLWLLWMLSQAWITYHIWNPREEKLARTEKLFNKPMYDAIFIDQSLALNRKRNNKSVTSENKDLLDADESDEYVSNSGLSDSSGSAHPIQEDETTRIYACATMWHETTEEMMEFLKSIMRLDEDQCAKRLVKKFLEYDIPDYYEIETHIFFDDAFIRKSVNDNDPKVNEWVEKLITAVDKAASEVHEVNLRVKAPKKYSTPYGGRLEWTLPGKTKMIAHLKDKAKIRAKKRWSQVMYMYYLLGHRLMERNDLSPIRKEIISQNTYILALDGDIDFQPQAVHLLVDLMKKNKCLGAACGRIHPIGSGIMVWYQKFEYAVGHWLQKAAEHMYGCVLCSPGCFSLFRAKALMDDSVMKKYTIRPEIARHFIQYDQGEDRWLCTLLLQRGYRVEYSAASDAYTHAPEGFNEFFNQRRRWMPSTCANIMDLIADSKRTIEVNDNISRGYIYYHIALMVGTILGPGTLFLMVVGALVTVFSFDQYTSLLWNLIPLVIYMIVCYYAKSNVQLTLAAIISGIYALVMSAVLVGVIIQISEDGWLAPSSLFLVLVGAEFIIAAILHPKEFGCLPYGIIYFVTIPSMYLILVIYSVFNLNNISWGTREVTVVPKTTSNEMSKDSKQNQNQKQSVKNKLYSLFGDGGDNAGSLEFSLGGLFKILLCSYRAESPEKTQLILIAESISKMEKKLDCIEKLVLLEPEEKHSQPNRSSSLLSRRRTTIMEGLKGELSKVVENEEDNISFISESQLSDELEPNSWMYEENVGRGEFGCISTKEKHFWEGLIDKYLHPIEDDKEKVAKDLKDFRDKAVLVFLMLNSLFVTVVFLLTLNKDVVHIQWPFGATYSFQYLDYSGDIEVEHIYLELEPIGVLFVLFFGLLMGSQFIGMLLHRFSTFCQILSSTNIKVTNFKKSLSKLSDEELLEQDPVRIVKKLIKLKGVDDDDDENAKEIGVERRKTVHNLAKNGPKPDEAATTDLIHAFSRRLTKFKNIDISDSTGRKSIVNAIEKRRSTLAHLKRSSFVSETKPRPSHVNFAFENDEFES